MAFRQQASATACTPSAAVTQVQHTEYQWAALVVKGGLHWEYKWTATTKNPTSDLAHIWVKSLDLTKKGAPQITRNVVDVQAKDAVTCTVALPQFEGVSQVTVPFTEHVSTFLYGVPGHPETEAITGPVTVTYNDVDQFWIDYKLDAGYTATNAGTTHIDFSDYKNTVKATSINDDGVGYVSQRDLTGVTGEPTFTTLYQMDSTDVWSCSGGEQSRTSRVIQSRVLTATPVANWNRSKVYGYQLGGIDETKGGTYVKGERLGAPYVGFCPAGEAFTGFLPHVFTNTVLPGVSVNGVALATA